MFGSVIAVAFWALVAALVAYGLACDLRYWLKEAHHRRADAHYIARCRALELRDRYELAEVTVITEGRRRKRLHNKNGPRSAGTLAARTATRAGDVREF